MRFSVRELDAGTVQYEGCGYTLASDNLPYVVGVGGPLCVIVYQPDLMVRIVDDVSFTFFVKFEGRFRF
jgi:hypothetical protein